MNPKCQSVDNSILFDVRYQSNMTECGYYHFLNQSKYYNEHLKRNPWGNVISIDIRSLNWPIIDDKEVDIDWVGSDRVESFKFCQNFLPSQYYCSFRDKYKVFDQTLDYETGGEGNHHPLQWWEPRINSNTKKITQKLLD